MVEAVDMFREGRATRTPQDDSKATYESWCRKKDAEIDWAKPAADVYNLIRGTNPQPGAWTTHNGKTLQIFDSAKVAGANGAPGEVLDVGEAGITIAAADGAILAKRVRPEGGDKIPAGEFAAAAGLKKGARLG
jgi:methionyl-tRNA formyltransferase